MSQAQPANQMNVTVTFVPCKDHMGRDAFQIHVTSSITDNIPMILNMLADGIKTVTAQINKQQSNIVVAHSMPPPPSDR